MLQSHSSASLMKSALFAFLWLPFVAFEVAQVEAQQVVLRVIDGDTFELSDGSRVRLIGVDTPEKFAGSKLSRDAERLGRDRGTIQVLGERASEFAARLVEGRPVDLEYDQANSASNHRDRYGRILAYVWLVENGQRSTFVNLQLIQSGYANAYAEYPFQYAEDFRLAERRAREALEGLWADEMGPAPGAAAGPTRIHQPTGDRDCGDFRTQAEAQRFFEAAEPGDSHRLDGDRDRVVCESLP